MFFSQDYLNLELLGVFKITREKHSVHTSRERIYDSISVRTEGRGFFKCEREAYCVERGKVIYIPHTVTYSQQTDGETVYAVHFINYNFRQKVYFITKINCVIKKE